MTSAQSESLSKNYRKAIKNKYKLCVNYMFFQFTNISIHYTDTCNTILITFSHHFVDPQFKNWDKNQSRAYESNVLENQKDGKISYKYS